MTDMSLTYLPPTEKASHHNSSVPCLLIQTAILKEKILTISILTVSYLNVINFSKLTNWVQLKNKHHHSKVLLNSFPMNGHTLGLCPYNQKLENFVSPKVYLWKSTVWVTNRVKHKHFHSQSEALRDTKFSGVLTLNSDHQTGTLKCARVRCRTCPFITNANKILGPKRTVSITDHFTCISANLIHCINCT